MRSAIRILCSEDKPAAATSKILEELEKKHPETPLDRRSSCDPTGNSRFTAMHVEADEVLKILKTFPAGSSGRSDGLTPQHLLDRVAGTPDEKLLAAITKFTNLLLSGNLPIAIREIIFGGRLIALQKKDGGIRLIALGYTLRLLAAKCANRHFIEHHSSELSPIQVGVGVSGEAKASATQFAESSTTWQTTMFW